MPPDEGHVPADRTEWVRPTLQVLDARSSVLNSAVGPLPDGSACANDGNTPCS